MNKIKIIMSKKIDFRKEAIKWLENEFPNGVDLVYVDYNDSFQDDMGELERILKTCDDMGVYEWYYESQSEKINDIQNECIEYLKNNIGEIEEIDYVYDTISDWLHEHDTSNVLYDLLRNTGDIVGFITTNYITCMNKSKLFKKFGKTRIQRHEIENVLHDTYYSTNISFYFEVNAFDLWKVLYADTSKYVAIKGSYISSIYRVDGSNNIGNNNVFDIILDKENFKNALYLDKAKNNGYGLYDILGYNLEYTADVFNSKTKKRGFIFVEGKVNGEIEREKELDENWKKTKECVFGDMKWDRHYDKEYINDFPCGWKCKKCGTFWID